MIALAGAEAAPLPGAVALGATGAEDGGFIGVLAEIAGSPQTGGLPPAAGPDRKGPEPRGRRAQVFAWMVPFRGGVPSADRLPPTGAPPAESRLSALYRPLTGPALSGGDTAPEGLLPAAAGRTATETSSPLREAVSRGGWRPSPPEGLPAVPRESSLGAVVAREAASGDPVAPTAVAPAPLVLAGGGPTARTAGGTPLPGNDGGEGLSPGRPEGTSRQRGFALEGRLPAAGGGGKAAPEPIFSPQVWAEPRRETSAVERLWGLLRTRIRRAVESGLPRAVELRLDPPRLGKLRIELSLEGERGIVAHLQVERPEAAAALNRQAGELGWRLAQTGAELREFQVTSGGAGGGGRQAGGHLPHPRAALPAAAQKIAAPLNDPGCRVDLRV